MTAYGNNKHIKRVRLDSPSKIAQGVALGTALDFLPMPFISIPVSYLLARLVRVNAAAAVLTVIFLKWAVPFFFAFNYYIGKILLGEAALYSAESSISASGVHHNNRIGPG